MTVKAAWSRLGIVDGAGGGPRPPADRLRPARAPRASAAAGGRRGVGLMPIGTSVEDAVDAAGGATCGPAWVALGDGPLGGRPLDRDDVITKGTRALFVVAAKSELLRRARAPLAESIRRS